MFLTKISTNYYSLVQAGVEGAYSGRDSVFFETSDGQLTVRLRAALHMENQNFFDYMRQHGEKRKVVSTKEPDTRQNEAGQLHVTERRDVGVDSTGMIS
jgi:hypothetical protein